MGEHETAHDNIFKMNQTLIDGLGDIIKYKPPAPEVLEKLKRNSKYFIKMADFINQGDFINLLRYYLDKEIKPMITGIYKSPKKFLLVDGLNLYYRLTKDITGGGIGLSEDGAEEFLVIFFKYYADMQIIIFAQENNTFFNNFKTKYRANFTKYDIVVINDAIENKTEIDDLLLVYIYFYINCIGHNYAYVLTFDGFSWVREFTHEEKEGNLFVNQPKLVRKLKNQISQHQNTVRPSITEEKLYMVAKKHVEYIKRDVLDEEAERPTSSMTRYAHSTSVTAQLDSDSDSDSESDSRSDSEGRSRSRSRSRRRGMSRRRGKSRRRGRHKSEDRDSNRTGAKGKDRTRMKNNKGQTKRNSKRKRRKSKRKRRKSKRKSRA